MDFQLEMSPTQKLVETEMQRPWKESRICPKLYFNACSLGPMIDRKKYWKLPMTSGPGPVYFMIKDFLMKVMKTVHDRMKVIQILKRTVVPKSEHLYTSIKVKIPHQKVPYYEDIPIVLNAVDVVDYCSNVCKEIKACPYLIGPLKVEGKKCPGGCNLKMCEADSGEEDSDFGFFDEK